MFQSSTQNRCKWQTVEFVGDIRSTLPDISDTWPSEDLQQSLNTAQSFAMVSAVPMRVVVILVHIGNFVTRMF